MDEHQSKRLINACERTVAYSKASIVISILAICITIAGRMGWLS